MTDRSVFISYSHSDAARVRRDAELLRAGGVQVFLDVRDIAYGARWRDALAVALAQCERVLVFWSAAARASEWVDREWRYALEMGKKIVPTLLDATPLPAELATFQALKRFRATVRRGPGKGRQTPPPTAIERPHEAMARAAGRNTFAPAAVTLAVLAFGTAGAYWAWRSNDAPSSTTSPAGVGAPQATAASAAASGPVPTAPTGVVVGAPGTAPPDRPASAAPTPIQSPAPAPHPPTAPSPMPPIEALLQQSAGWLLALVIAAAALLAGLALRFKQRRAGRSDGDEARRFVQAVFAA